MVGHLVTEDDERALTGDVPSKAGMSALLELADRCEQATGPDRELDWAIEKVVHPRVNTKPEHDFPMSQDPAYTASLDAAMTLVPEAALFTARTLWDGDRQSGFASVSRYENAEVRGHHRRYWMDEHQSIAITPALALCAAALRARAAQ